MTSEPEKVASRYQEFLEGTIPSTWTVDAPHIRLISEHLDKVASGEIDRLAIHMPPRHGKSETVTYRFPVYWLQQNPEHNVLVTGYNERFARRFGRRTRNIAQGLGVTGDKKAADEWETKEGGLLMTRGVGSPPTGTGFQLIVIDDPVRRREDAESPTLREKTLDWYTDDLYSRLEPGGAIVLIMTLWHEDDIGHSMVASEPGRWTVLKLPALAIENDPLGRKEGEALWPERFSEAQLHRIRDVMRKNEGDRGFEALYQQNPTPREGSFFKPSALQVVDSAPANLREVRCWDIASSEGKGDYTAGVKMGANGDGIYYVTDVVRGQWSSDERDSMMRQTAELDGKEVRIGIPQDPGAAGKSLAQAMVRMLAGFSVKSAPVSGKKEVRADPVGSQVNAGNVRLVRGDWNRDFIEELRTFPNGKNDDQVDAFADAFNELANNRRQVFFI